MSFAGNKGWQHNIKTFDIDSIAVQFQISLRCNLS